MAQLDKKRLIAVLGMLGSNGDGEVINAGRLAHKMILQAKLTWSDVIVDPPWHEEPKKAQEAPREEAKAQERPRQQRQQSSSSQARGEAGNGSAKPSTDSYRKEPLPQNVQAMMAYCRTEEYWSLSPFHQDFLKSLDGWSGRVTKNQFRTLARLHAKCKELEKEQMQQHRASSNLY